MPSAYHPDESDWACYVDGNGQPQHLFDAAWDPVPSAEVAASTSGSKSAGSKRSGSKRSGSSKLSKDPKHSSSLEGLPLLMV